MKLKLTMSETSSDGNMSASSTDSQAGDKFLMPKWDHMIASLYDQVRTHGDKTYEKFFHSESSASNDKEETRKLTKTGQDRLWTLQFHTLDVWVSGLDLLKFDVSS